jgi:hypothetical protein
MSNVNVSTKWVKPPTQPGFEYRQCYKNCHCMKGGPWHGPYRYRKVWFHGGVSSEYEAPESELKWELSLPTNKQKERAEDRANQRKERARRRKERAEILAHVRSHKKRVAQFGHQKLATEAMAELIRSHKKTITLWCGECDQGIVFDGMGRERALSG